MRCCSATWTGWGCRPGNGRDVHVGVGDGHESNARAAPPCGRRCCRDAMGRLSSLPSQTPPTYLPVKPTNQTSLGPVLVPVLPATLVKSSVGQLAGAVGHDLVQHLVHAFGDLAA